LAAMAYLVSGTDEMDPAPQPETAS
jgi:hypothetical protein